MSKSPIVNVGYRVLDKGETPTGVIFFGPDGKCVTLQWQDESGEWHDLEKREES